MIKHDQLNEDEQFAQWQKILFLSDARFTVNYDLLISQVCRQGLLA